MVGIDLRKHYSEVLQDKEVLLKRIRGLRYTPYVNNADLVDVIRILKAIPALENSDTYPIASAGDLLRKFGDYKKGLDIDGISIYPELIINNMPSYYFPIIDLGNFIEKTAELIRKNRARIDITKELKVLKLQIGRKLKFPINNIEDLIEKLGSKTSYKVGGKAVTAAGALDIIPPELFPMKDKEDFYRKVRFMLSSVTALRS
jgi:hypothetical protein